MVVRVCMNVKYTKEVLEPLILQSTTWLELCLKVGTKPATGSQTHLKKVAVKFGIDFSHFVGKSGMVNGVPPNKKDIQEYLIKNSRISSDRLRRRLINSGLKDAKCEKCGIDSWLGEKAPLELDHIDNDHFNNELSNLQILCPNCHSLKTRAALSSRKHKR